MLCLVLFVRFSSVFLGPFPTHLSLYSRACQCTWWPTVSDVQTRPSTCTSWSRTSTTKPRPSERGWRSTRSARRSRHTITNISSQLGYYVGWEFLTGPRLCSTPLLRCSSGCRGECPIILSFLHFKLLTSGSHIILMNKYSDSQILILELLLKNKSFKYGCETD